MTYRHEFPDFDPSTMPQIPTGFVDESWGNDICPSFYCARLGLTLWVDFADPDCREFPEAPRFTMTRQPSECGLDDVLAYGDSWGDVLGALAIIIEGKAK